MVSMVYIYTYETLFQFHMYKYMHLYLYTFIDVRPYVYQFLICIHKYVYCNCGKCISCCKNILISYCQKGLWNPTVYYTFKQIYNLMKTKTILTSFAFSTVLKGRTHNWDIGNMICDNFVRPNWKHTIKMKYEK